MPREDKKQHFKVLGLDSSASESDVRRAYSKLVLQHHPQKSSGGGSESTFEDVSKAFRFLTEMDGECSKADNDQVFLNFFRELLGAGNASWPDDIIQKARAADADFEYRCPDDDEVELDSDKVECLIDIISNYKKRGKNIPMELSSEKLEWCKEQLQQKDEKKKDYSKKTTKKSKAATSVPIAKPKPKSKKQLLAEQRRREREIGQIALELEEKRKEEEAREKQRKQLEVEKQKRLEEERIKAQAEARETKGKLREEKEREKQRKIEQEKEERRRKLQEEERRRKEEEEKRRKAEKEKVEKEKQVRLKAQQAAKEKEDQLKAQSNKNQANKKSVQQQQRNEQNMYPREIPPRFQKKMKQQQQGQPINQTQSQPVAVTQTKQPPIAKPPPTVSRKKDPNRWNNSEFSGIIGHKEDDGGWSQAGPAQGTGWSEYNPENSTENTKWGSEIPWGGKEGNWDNVVVDSKDDEAWPSMNGTKDTQLPSKPTETLINADSEWTDKSVDKNPTSNWGNSNADNSNWTGDINKTPVAVKTQSPVKAPVLSSLNKSQAPISKDKSSSSPNLSANWGGPSPSGWGGIIPYSENWDNVCDDSVDAAIDAVDISQTVANGKDPSWNKVKATNGNSWTKQKTSWENNGNETVSVHSGEQKPDNAHDIDSNNIKSTAKDWSKTPGKGINTKGSGWNDLVPTVNTWDNNPVSKLDSIPLPGTNNNKVPVGTHKAPGASTVGWGSNIQSVVGNNAQTKTKFDSSGLSGVAPVPAPIVKPPPIVHTPVSVPVQPPRSTPVSTKVSLPKEKNTKNNAPVWGEPQSGATGWGDTENWDTAGSSNKPVTEITGTSCWDQASNKKEASGEKSPLNMATPTAEKVTGWLESNPPASGWSEVEDIDLAEAWGGGWTTASSKRNKGSKTVPVANDSNAWMTRAMKQLLDMGFKQEDAEKALKANHMNIESAIGDLLTMAASCEEKGGTVVQTAPPNEPDPAEAAKLLQEQQQNMSDVPKLNRKQRRRLQQLAQQEDSTQEKNEVSAETNLENSSAKPSVQTSGKSVNNKDSKTDNEKQGGETLPEKSPSVNSNNKSIPLSSSGPSHTGTVPTPIRPALPQQFLQQQFMQQQMQLRFAQAGLMQPPAVNAQQMVMLQQLAQLQMMQQRLAAQSAAQQQMAQKQSQIKPSLQQQQLALMIGQIQQQINLQQQQILVRSTPQHQQQQIQQLILQQQQKAQQQQQQQEVKQPQPVDQPAHSQADVNKVQPVKTKEADAKQEIPSSSGVTATPVSSTLNIISPVPVTSNDIPKRIPVTLPSDIPMSQPQQPQLTQSRLQQWRQPIATAEPVKIDLAPVPTDRALSNPMSINTVLAASAAPGSFSPLVSSSLSPVKAGLPKESVSSRWGVDASLRLSADPPEFKPGVPWKPRELRDHDEKDRADDNISVPSPTSGSLAATDSAPGSLSSSNSSLVRPPSASDKVAPIGTAPRPPPQESLGSALSSLSIAGPFSDPMWRAPSEKITPNNPVNSGAGPVRPPPGLNGKNNFAHPPAATPPQQPLPSHSSWGPPGSVKPPVSNVNHSNPILGGLGYGTTSPWGSGDNFHPFNSNSSSVGAWPTSTQPPIKPPEIPISAAPGQIPSVPSTPGSLSPGKGEKESTVPGENIAGPSGNVNPPRMGGSILGATGNPSQMSTWLVLRNLSPRINPAVLRSLCQQHGPLLTFQLNLRHGNSLIRYSSKEEAASARNMLNSTPVCGESITASFANDGDIGSFFDQTLDWSSNSLTSETLHSGTGWPQFNHSHGSIEEMKKYPAVQQPIIPNNVNLHAHIGNVPMGVPWGSIPIPNSYVPQASWSFSQYNTPGGAIPPPVGNLWSNRNEIPVSHDGLPQESGLTSPSMTTFLPPGLLNGSESM